MPTRNLIKLRGLPWNATPLDILSFLEDVEVMNGEKGVYMAISPRDGRPNGEAFLELASPDDVDKAFSYNKNTLGHRYIESKDHTKIISFGRYLNYFYLCSVFNAKPEEFDQCLRRQNVIQQDTFIKLRGLPFSCRLDDIEQFFSGEWPTMADIE
jgi:heterogeneous nuclear ribonucleoprotein F/H